MFGRKYLLVVFYQVEIGAALKLQECQNILVGKSKQAEWIWKERKHISSYYVLIFIKFLA